MLSEDTNLLSCRSLTDKTSNEIEQRIARKKEKKLGRNGEKLKYLESPHENKKNLQLKRRERVDIKFKALKVTRKLE